MSNEFKSIFKKEIQMFIDAKRASGLKYKSEELKMYQIDKRLLSINLKDKRITKETFDILVNWKDKKVDQQAHYFIVVKQFCKYLRIIGLNNIYIEDRSFNIERSFFPVIFSDDQFYEILRVADERMNIQRNHRSLRYYRLYYSCCIILRILYSCGLRISEAIHLNIDDVNMDLQTLTIFNSKRRISRTIVFSDSMAKCFEEYIKEFSITDGHLFVNTWGSVISRVCVSNYYKSILTELGYDITARIHDIRHVFTILSP